MSLQTIHAHRERWRDWGDGYTKHLENCPDLASQMGRVCTAGIVDPSYHARPALSGPSVFCSVVMHARNLMLRTSRWVVVISEAGCTVTWPINVKRTRKYGGFIEKT